MNTQSKVIETVADFRARTASAAKHVESLKVSLASLRLAGREFGKVARRHATRFVTENLTLARDAGKDVTALARATYSNLAKQDAGARATRKPAGARRRKASGSRSRANAKTA